MRATRLALVLLIVLVGALGGAALVAEETGKAASPKADEKKAEEAKKGKPPAPATAPTAKPAAPQKVVSDTPGYVYTNEDLDRLQPPSPLPAIPGAQAKDAAPKPGAKAAGGPPDPLKQIADEKARAADLEAKTAEAEKKVADAQQKVRDLEKRRLAVANPFMAPPQVPDEQREQWRKMNGVERLAETDAELAKARKELDDATAALQKLRDSSGTH